MLHVLRQQENVEIAGLLSTFNEAAERVAMHAVRRELVEAQARAAGLSLWPVQLPWPCSNEQYEERMRDAITLARSDSVTHVAFGDLFLSDIREYRTRQLAGTGIAPLFPIWSAPDRTRALAERMHKCGQRAIVTCVDTGQLDESFAGREFGPSLLRDLPNGVDPCGENGEFHTFCYAGPAFDREISVDVGDIVRRDGFVYTDVMAVARPAQ
jgi:diphthamide synthase (EF-2-diphthine--ammonia ligase)